jgi:hypothetical protein
VETEIAASYLQLLATPLCKQPHTTPRKSPPFTELPGCVKAIHIEMANLTQSFYGSILLGLHLGCLTFVGQPSAFSCIKLRASSP